MPENVSGYQRTTIHPKRDFIMSATFNHTIVAAADPAASAQFYVDILEAEHTQSWGPFANIMLSDGVMLQFAAPPPGYDILPVHMAFLCSDDHFDRALHLLKRRRLDFWADPQRTRPQETNTSTGAAASTSSTRRVCISSSSPAPTSERSTARRLTLCRFRAHACGDSAASA